MGSAQGLVNVAQSYLGMTEDDPRFTEMIDYYNEHTGGYDMRYWDEWCACFVSVCSLKSGNSDATGTSVNCATFREIWREKGIYRDAGSVPDTGWLIDYDWEQDGIPDHIGIVVDCDGSTIHVIEGNTDGEMCAEHWIPVDSASISCYGAPNYDGEGGNDLKLVNVPKKNDPIYRLFDPDTGEHFYTSNAAERDACVNRGWRYEGIAWTCPAPEVPVYRMHGDMHLFTANYGEAEAVQTRGWEYEGVDFFAASNGTPVYKLFDADSGDHLLTVSTDERNKCISRGWSNEGVAFYV